jgi:hypothetical protein
MELSDQSDLTKYKPVTYFVVSFGHLIQLKSLCQYVLGSWPETTNNWTIFLQMKIKLNKLGFGIHFNPCEADQHTKVFITIKAKEILQSNQQIETVFEPIDQKLKLNQVEKERLIALMKKCNNTEPLSFAIFSYRGF